MPLGLSLTLILMVLGVVSSLILTIIFCFTVVPNKKRDSLKGFGRFLNDLFNFRGLLIESIVKTLYVFITVTFVVVGFFMLFAVNTSENIFTGETTTVWYGWIGLISMIVGPIVTRLIFEGLMLFILLVKNTIQINNKLKDQYSVDECSKKEKKHHKQAPVTHAVVTPPQPKEEAQTLSETQE